MTCTRCEDTGWEPVDRDGVRRVERCACWQERLTAELLREARIPPRYAKCHLDNFVLYPNERLVSAVAKARRFADTFPAVTKGLCLIGPPGIGKTHIAAAVLRHVVITHRTRAIFYDVRELLRVIRSTYNPVVKTAEMDILRPVIDAELLVLDDLGAEKPSDWVEETLNLIVNTRYNERRPTIFTTNYEDFPDETDLNSLKVRIGFRMYSRLNEMCELLEYDGSDYRLLPVNGGPDDLTTMWHRNKGRRTLPGRTHGQAKAQIREPREPRELNWPGGKAGRS